VDTTHNLKATTAFSKKNTDKKECPLQQKDSLKFSSLLVALFGAVFPTSQAQYPGAYQHFKMRFHMPVVEMSENVHRGE